MKFIKSFSTKVDAIGLVCNLPAVVITKDRTPKVCYGSGVLGTLGTIIEDVQNDFITFQLKEQEVLLSLEEQLYAAEFSKHYLFPLPEAKNNEILYDNYETLTVYSETVLDVPSYLTSLFDTARISYNTPHSYSKSTWDEVSVAMFGASYVSSELSEDEKYCKVRFDLPIQYIKYLYNLDACGYLCNEITQMTSYVTRDYPYRPTAIAISLPDVQFAKENSGSTTLDEQGFEKYVNCFTVANIDQVRFLFFENSVYEYDSSQSLFEICVLYPGVKADIINLGTTLYRYTTFSLLVKCSDGYVYIKNENATIDYSTEAEIEALFNKLYIDPLPVAQSDEILYRERPYKLEGTTYVRRSISLLSDTYWYNMTPDESSEYQFGSKIISNTAGESYNTILFDDTVTKFVFQTADTYNNYAYNKCSGMYTVSMSIPKTAVFGSDLTSISPLRSTCYTFADANQFKVCIDNKYVAYDRYTPMYINYIGPKSDILSVLQGDTALCNMYIKCTDGYLYYLYDLQI